ncbi:MAG: MFS transporter [Chthoniobacterales bacterium]|nr:MFS transporter [Chthoniobacterales bacterium]
MQQRKINRLMRFADVFGLQRNLVLLLATIALITTGEELWMRFLPKYLQALGAGVLIIGAFDALRTALGAIYAYPGGIFVDRWGHRRALVGFTLLSIAGYALVALVPHWSAVIGGMFLFLAWTCFSLPATFSLVGASLAADRHAMGIAVQSFVKRLPIIVGPLLGGMLIDHFGLIPGVRLGLLVSCGLGSVALAVQLRIRETPRVLTPTLDNFWSIAKSMSPGLRRLLLSDILIRFCERLPFAWVVIYSMDFVRVNAKGVGLLTAIEMMTAMACTIPASYFADKYKREPFIIATFVFFTLFPISLLVATTFPLLILAFVVRGFKEFGEPARKAQIIGYCPVELRGRMIGCYYMIRDLIVATGAILGAALWKFGPEVNFMVAAFLGFTGTIFYCVTYFRNSHAPPR